MSNAEAQARFRAKHPDKARAAVRRGLDKLRFGGNRKAVLERDMYMCVRCDMTDKTHRENWGRGLTIDHIDNKGRYSVVKNHSIDNLMTLCLRCHGRKDALVRHNRNKEKKW